MFDLISRQKALNSVHSSVSYWDGEDVHDLIDIILCCLQDLPCSDAQQVVMCKDCIHYKPNFSERSTYGKYLRI